MGIFGDAYGAVAGVADHATGSVDESIGRQFDDTPGGGFFEAGPNTDDETESVAGFDPWGDSQSNPLLEVGPARTAYDVVFSYDETLNGQEDTADVLGPTVGGVVDAVVTVDGEEVGSEERKGRTFLLLVGAAIALYLLAPLFEVVAAFGGDDG
ncbi:hypothetical protein C2R22_10730 [Salinigranum rubrum]|uniref:Uncharacterized protein n=1 Tax=Salinigranum rubrum TaxID=755307 RepID=A0A2I8VJJ3_9EURY|nr:hypothetical protein [Salinigranum rubrum]AUV82064.1 hypothetical protein C2R22_10730 [Salinigranum rubrum]